MEVNFGNNNLNTNNNQGAFENILGAVAGNQFFDVEALKNIQTEELRAAFNDWAGNEFLSEDSNQGDWLKTSEELEDEEKYAGVSFGMKDFVKGMDEYREDWAKFDVAEGKRESLRAQIESEEREKTFAASLSEVTENNKQIAGLQMQILQVQEE